VRLIGGGQVRPPGEGSLAHQGMLFLDELPEFRRHVLWGELRQPLVRVLYEYNLPRVISLCDVVSLANRLLTASQSSPAP
jgi:hypothetical protein